jgi:hypothetical protein
MAQFTKYQASYAVEGVRFFYAPTIRTYGLNAGDAELSMIILLQQRWPGRCITISTIYPVSNGFFRSSFR